MLWFQRLKVVIISMISDKGWKLPYVVLTLSVIHLHVVYYKKHYHPCKPN